MFNEFLHAKFYHTHDMYVMAFPFIIDSVDCSPMYGKQLLGAAVFVTFLTSEMTFTFVKIYIISRHLIAVTICYNIYIKNGKELVSIL
jgi:hypothetical protein